MHPRPGLAREETGLELGGPGRGHVRTDLLELGDGLFVAVRLGERFGAGQRRLDAAALVGRDAVGQIAGVDVEAAREPRDRLAGRAGLAALDLADVLLREPIARELALCQARGDAQLAHALTEPKGCGTRGLRDGRRGRRATQGAAFHRTVKRTLHLFASTVRVRSPKRVAITGKPGSSSQMRNHLTELLDFLGNRLYCEFQPRSDGHTPDRPCEGRARCGDKKARRHWLGRRANSLRAVAPKARRGGGFSRR